MAYFHGSSDALTLTQAASQIAYCYTCQVCGFRERVRLTRIAADYEPQTQVGDLLTKLPCGRCGDTKKIVMSLWLHATTTDKMLTERGYPVWEQDE